ncbi:unnamed protein product [Mesocestoides corti]|uniref:Secreted protein n=1 Tax=Mesocestoides corti TaxID=53468 RepID=A0A0R3UQF4_MESCO|nr:unnamed protein product [Mesocestoides corti]
MLSAEWSFVTLYLPPPQSPPPPPPLPLPPLWTGLVFCELFAVSPPRVRVCRMLSRSGVANVTSGNHPRCTRQMGGLVV